MRKSCKVKDCSFFFLKVLFYFNSLCVSLCAILSCLPFMLWKPLHESACLYVPCRGVPRSMFKSPERYHPSIKLETTQLSIRFWCSHPLEYDEAMKRTNCRVRWNKEQSVLPDLTPPHLKAPCSLWRKIPAVKMRIFLCYSFIQQEHVHRINSINF